MTDILGFEVNLPTINLTGALSNSWIYILIVGIVGFILLVVLALVLFFRTYKKRIIVFENVSGLGYQPLLKTRGRIIKLGSSGEEVMKTLAGGRFLTAYGKKMGRNTYWFAKGPDGYLYNVLLGDLDTKMRILDIEPVDRDVRMFHISLDRLAHETYDRKSFMEKYGSQLIMFLFLILLVVAMVVIIGKIGKSTEALAATAQTNQRVVEALGGILKSADNIQEGSSGTGGSGLIPAS